ncbi:MAG TPA: M20/M25/M40 family metallo-hydrolase [Pirellulales bacterium]|nr:M20/M25/M40 family metallo-hydrolase [Pirellulales bacterium]
MLVDRLRRHVDRLAGLIGPRHIGRPKTLEATVGLIEAEFSNAGYQVERQPYLASGVEVANLVIEIAGSDRPTEIVILGAHYDTISSTPGADDNASAVAVLLEVARLFREWRPRRTVRFIAFPCEEMPHFHTHEMGSQVYAKQCRARGERIVGMLCLEMVGFFTKELGVQQLPPGIPRFLRPIFPRRGDFLAAVGNLRSWRLLRAFRRGFKRVVRFPLFSIVLPERIEDIRRSDNASFWDQGYQALMLTDTSYLRNRHYHMPTDTPETLDYRSMAQVTHGILGGLARVAIAPRISSA